jgi:hypothetical protein
LSKAIFALRGRGRGAASWTEATYFCAFQADVSLDEAARALAAAIDPERDMIVVGVVGTGEAVYCGQLQHAAAFRAIFPGARPLERG